MNRLVKNSLIIGGILAVTTGVVIYLTRQFKLLADSCYSFAGAVLHNISADDVKMTIFFKVVNKSDLSVKIENIIFNIYVNNLFVTKIYKKEKQKLLSNSSKVYQLDVQFSPKELLRSGIANIAPLLADRDKLVITVKGTFDAESGILRVNKQEFEEKITLKELLSPSPNTAKC